MISSRDISFLHSDLREIARRFLSIAKAQGINCVICCTYRDNEEQNRLYSIGRETSGHIVTNAKAGQSAHNVYDTLVNRPSSLAFDIAVFDGGKYATDSFDGWQKCGKIGMDLGLEWLGVKGSPFFELAHFQIKDWKNYGH